MGFLIGMYGKLAAGKRLRSLQARMMSVQSQLRRATRDVENMEKQFSQQEKLMKNSMSQWSSNLLLGMQNAQMSSIFSQFGITDASQVASLSGEAQTNFYAVMQGFSTMNAASTQSMHSFIQNMTTMQENQLEAQKELQLQPLKDLEEELETEKDSLESQIQLAQQDYEACKEMEKAGAKNLVPNYTGQ